MFTLPKLNLAGVILSEECYVPEHVTFVSLCVSLFCTSFTVSVTSFRMAPSDDWRTSDSRMLVESCGGMLVERERL